MGLKTEVGDGGVGPAYFWTDLSRKLAPIRGGAVTAVFLKSCSGTGRDGLSSSEEDR